LKKSLEEEVANHESAIAEMRHKHSHEMQARFAKLCANYL